MSYLKINKNNQFGTFIQKMFVYWPLKNSNYFSIHPIVKIYINSNNNRTNFNKITFNFDEF